MREICTSGSMSREWKRTVWQAPQARRTTPRHFLTLPIDPRPSHQDRRYRLMASDRKIVEFLVEQMASGGTVSAKVMFGEFGIYCDGKMVALVCDDHLFLKPMVGGRAFAVDAEEAPPYPGAKPCLLINAEKWDDCQWLAEIVRITSQELPVPKVRTKRKSG